MIDRDKRVGALLAAGDTTGAVTLVLRELGPELVGFLSGVLRSDDQADEVFASLSEHLWRSLQSFEGRCSIRTWTYVLARREIGRYRQGIRKHAKGRVPISEVQEILTVARTVNSSALNTDKQRRLSKLREALSEEERILLVLRVDRNLSWDEIALAFADDREALGEQELKRESMRLRKRFQILKRRLTAQVRGPDAVAD